MTDGVEEQAILKFGNHAALKVTPDYGTSAPSPGGWQRQLARRPVVLFYMDAYMDQLRVSERSVIRIL